MKLLAGFLSAVMLLPIGCDLARAASLPQLEQPVLNAEVLVKVPEEGSAPADTEVESESDIASPGSDSPQAQLPVEEDTPLTVVTDPDSPYGLDGKKIFNPDPTRAVWLSALFPGLGQIYNRRYWKLPIIVAGYMGLGYGTSWNARMYQDYQQAYADVMDDDPDTKAYLDFFPPNVDESTLDHDWLARTFKSRKDYYRRNRDLCIICCVGLYLLAMLDAYVDASLSHFEVSDDISLDVAPSILVIPGQRRPTPALNWAFTF
ncbi:MAG: hypothetical protein HDS25_02035 [Bacteroides sp.]|nr:hypothetical protein [Bacteroides sp.]